MHRLGHVDVHIYCSEWHTFNMHITLCSAFATMQVGCVLEWMHDLKPVFEVRWAREWEVMDLCFMTCFTGTLPFSVTPAHLWPVLQILIAFIQSWQPCIIHPSLLCFSLFCYFESSCMYSSLSHCLPLLLSSGLRRCSPCTPWRGGSCLNRTTMMFLFLHALYSSLWHARKNRHSFPQCSRWRGQSVCSACYGCLCCMHILAFIVMHKV